MHGVYRALGWVHGVRALATPSGTMLFPLGIHLGLEEVEATVAEGTSYSTIWLSYKVEGALLSLSFFEEDSDTLPSPKRTL